MSICFQCGVNIPRGPEGEDYKWCSIECKKTFHDENFGDGFTTKTQLEANNKDDFKDLIDDANEGKEIKTDGNGFFDEKKEVKHNLNIEPKVGFFTRLWNKTVFPDKIKAKKEEKALRRKLEQEAKMEALSELGPELKKAYKKKEIDKLLGKKEGASWLKKIGDELAATGRNVNAGKFKMGGGALGGGSAGPSTEKLMNALGKAPNVNPQMGLNKGVNQDKITKILRKGKGK